MDRIDLTDASHFDGDGENLFSSGVKNTRIKKTLEREFSVGDDLDEISTLSPYGT